MIHWRRLIVVAARFTVLDGVKNKGPLAGSI